MKIKGKSGYRYIRELGGAIDRKTISATAQFLFKNNLLKGNILDYGCGFGFDANHFGWDKYDPHYFQLTIAKKYDTIVCNHVANILTRKSRLALYKTIQDALTESGTAYTSVTRKIPEIGKMGLRKRIQSYVVLNLPSVYKDLELEIYSLRKNQTIEDLTKDFEKRF
jgi:hypothetical protein